MAYKGLSSGFTLIEILVVLVIMGFLVAMVAPKLAGIVDSSVSATDDSNQQRLNTALDAYINQNNSLPGGLTTLIKYHTDATVIGNAAIPAGDDGDQSTKEFLSSELVERMKPKLHYLTTEEADELTNMGLKGVMLMARVADAAALSLTTGDADEDNYLELEKRTNVQAGLPVFMIGVGDEDGDGVIAASEFATGNSITVDADAAVTETSGTATSLYTDAATGNIQGAIAATSGFVRFDEARNIGRIVMGVSNKGPLVQNGMLKESGTSPRSLQRANHYMWGNYLIVLPRLKSTMDLLDDIDGDGQKGSVQVVLLDAETGTTATGVKILSRSPNKGFGKFQAQDVTMFTTASPEGHSWGSVADAFAASFKD